jgi:divalent metal cation (Fe/Co/Zn/Cd) transporter
MNAYAIAALAAEPAFSKEDVKPGWVALGIVAILCVATYFLVRSFIRHAKKAQQPWQGEDHAANRTTPHDRR